MSTMTVLSIFISLSAFFSYINFRLIKLPTTIGVMVLALLMSVILLFIPSAADAMRPVIDAIDFPNAVMHGMLSFLLFAGALHVDFVKLRQHRLMIFILAFVGTLFSTFAVGYFLYFLLGFLGIQIDLVYALLFGALISPTDPIAVMAILKKAGIAESLEIKVVGESLFNDGMAVVIFVVLLGMLQTGHVAATHVLSVFVEEVLGGILLGAILGFIVYRLMCRVDEYKLEVLLTLALVMGGYELARYLDVSGPIAMVVAGLMIGNIAHDRAMSEQTRRYINGFWELIDEFLNVLLFLMIGLELLVLPFSSTVLSVGLIMIPALLIIRYISSFVPVTLLSRFEHFSPGTVNILTWGGLRGGLSVALALSLPESDAKSILLQITYCIVLFSIIVQGLTIGKLARHYAE